MWHGVGDAEAWRRVCDGEGLQLPTKHVHDVGDYGLGIYLTSSKFRARVYAVAARMTIDGKRYLGLVKARVRLRNALHLDWRSRHAMDPMSVAYETIEKLREAYGDPLHGSDAERRQAAIRWREGLLASGIDGIVAYGTQDIEAVTYQPNDAIVSYDCVLIRRK